MRFSGLRIRWLIVGLLVVSIAPPVGLIAYDAYSHARNQIARDADVAHRVAMQNAQSLEHYLEDQRQALGLLAEHGVRLLNPAQCKPLAESFAARHPSYANLVVRDRSDRPICGAARGSGPPAEALDPGSFQRALLEKRFVVGQPIIGPVSKVWVSILRYPIVDSAGNAVGVVNLPVRLESLAALVPWTGPPAGGVVSVLAGDGTVVTRSVDADAWIGRNVRGLGAAGEILRRGSGETRGPGFDGVDSVLGFAPVPSADWRVVGALSVEAASAPAREELQRDLVVLLAVLVLVLVLAVAIARSIAVPVRKLAQLADAAAAAGYGQARAEEDGPHEIATVSRAFNRMLEARARAEAELRASEQRYRLAASTGDVWDADLLTGRGYMPPQFKRLLGYEDHEIENRYDALEQLLHPEDLPRMRQALARHIADRAPYELELRVRTKSGAYRWISTRGQAIWDENGRATYMAGTTFDITERKSFEARIAYLATHDELTDLPNRSLVGDRIAQALHRARRGARPLALMFVDLDRFKLINDGYGHPFGDALLRAAAGRLAAVVRDGDTVARQSGDEFLILLADLRRPTDAQVVAQKVKEAFEQPFRLEGREVYVTASVGLSVFPQDGEDAATLTRNADAAMQRAKELGKNTYQFFTAAMSEETHRRVELETQLRGALANGELSLVYQPKVNLASGRISGCEALLRWSRPQAGPISPARFIPIAEETGLIVPIGDWVLRTACARNRAWRESGHAPIVVSVNVSARQFLQQDVVGWVLNELRASGLGPEQLELELTESIIAQDAEKVIATMRELKAEGVKLSIDDFGTGYSSLSYLKRFPVDTLKIDQSFIRNMLTEPKDAAIARSVISLAHALGLEAIAEGVETAEHCAFLRQHGCDTIQGYYFSKPVPEAEFEQLLAGDRRLPATQDA